MESCSTSTALAKGLRKLRYHVAVFDCYQIHQFL
jgi:transposase